MKSLEAWYNAVQHSLLILFKKIRKNYWIALDKTELVCYHSNTVDRLLDLSIIFCETPIAYVHKPIGKPMCKRTHPAIYGGRIEAN